MPNENTIENELYNSLGKEYFFLVSPFYTGTEFIQSALEVDKKLAKKVRDNKIKQKVNEFINSALGPASPASTRSINPPAVLEAEKDRFSPLMYNFLLAQHKLQQARFIEALPEFAMYALEFFIKPLTEQEKIELKIIDSHELELQQTIEIDMPFELKIDEQGYFDVNATIEHEARYNLIKSKLAGITKVEQAADFLYNDLINFPSWAFFAINHKDEIRVISQHLIQAVFDIMMNFIYEQLTSGTGVQEAEKNAIAYVQGIARERRLEEMLVYRAEETIPLDIFLLELLGELKGERKYIKEQTLKDFYTHALIKLNNFILKNYIIPGTTFSMDLRKATQEEFEAQNNEYTVEISPLLPQGSTLRLVKELYQVKLSETALKNLIVISTNGLEMKEYYI